jgi:Flp pilus assembly pilin Flp
MGQPSHARKIIRWALWGALLACLPGAITAIGGFTYLFVNLTGRGTGSLEGTIEVGRLASLIAVVILASAGALVGALAAVSQAVVEAINRLELRHGGAQPTRSRGGNTDRPAVANKGEHGSGSEAEPGVAADRGP